MVQTSRSYFEAQTVPEIIGKEKPVSYSLEACRSTEFDRLPENESILALCRP
jgi:hypothetical protein